jgi:proton-dependent oligopeptide transporter, POT family
MGVWLFGATFELGMGARAAISAVSVVIGFALFFYRQKLAPDDSFLATVVASLARGPKRARTALGDEAYDGMLAVFRASSVIAFVVLFWALFDQKDSTWQLQAMQMDRTFHLPFLGAITLLPNQTGAANSILVLLLIPLFVFWIYPALEKRGVKVTPIRRMAFGMFMTATSFVTVAILQHLLDAGVHVHWAWQIIAFALLTASEVLVSATGLEFAYGQAPRRMKSTLMAFWYLTVTFGNLFVVLVIALTKDYSIATRFWLFAAMMAGVAILFTIRMQFYKGREYPQ